ncbi:rho GTPase-activating protein 27 isoform X2 [Kryptolebias marmoratus]|uniref:rho GTPase-activating protein 27 isoform X2 n=1 Tax=Kryptolebias marmoratus TaxID=37003 RepID=UPI0007F9252B|nr:rho GTPase-activating protein 27 isoform X2 [Kryptolebias marmoratus]
MAAASSLLSKGLGLVLVEFKYEYEVRDGVLISIKPNERYVLLAKTNDHWWLVWDNSNSRSFYIPANYVKELPADFPSPLDFADPPGPEQVLHPVVAPVPVPVPVPKPLEEPSGTRTKQSDEMLIRLRPNVSNRHQKNENRMSTFGVPMDLPDLTHIGSSSKVHGNPPGGSAETRPTAPSGTTNMADSKKQPHPSGLMEDQKDSGKPRVPSFSPADPRTTIWPQNQPIPVETPMVPLQNNKSSPPQGQHGNQEPEEEEEEEVAEEETSSESSEEEEESRREECSHHIYESIQDLNLDLEALQGAQQSPAAPSEPAPPAPAAPAAPPTAHAAPPTKQDQSSLNPSSSIYANVSSLKKNPQPQILISSPPTADPAPSAPGHTLPSSSSSSSMISPTSPVSPLDRWQVHTDQDSGKPYYFHPITRQLSWTDHRDNTSSSDMDLSSPLSPASSQGSCGWEQLLDEASGRIYFYNPNTGATAWTVPRPLGHPSPPGSTAGKKTHDDAPPLPKEDYPVDEHDNDKDAVFVPAAPLPKPQLDLKDPSSLQKQQEKRLMGNGVSEDGAPVQMFTPGHRRFPSDFTETIRKPSPNSPQFSNRHKLRRNLSNQSTGFKQQHVHAHLLEKAGILNKTKVADLGKKIRKNWSQSWTVLHGGILTFYKDPKSNPAGNSNKASQIVPEYTVDLRGSSIQWATKDKSSKKHVLELKTRQGCEYLMQYDTESIISDWFKVVQDTIQQLTPQQQLEKEHPSDDEDETSSDREDKDRKRPSTRDPSGADLEQSRIRRRLRRFLQRRPTLQSVKERGYIKENVFGCHLDTLCHRENSTIPKFVEKCVRTVERRGLDVDGIYRVSGNLAVIQKLRHKADHEEHLDLEDGQWEEIHVITGALKLFFRELPEPLFPFSSFEKFIAAIQVPDYSLKVSYMKDLVRSLPLPNYDTMELLFKHLRKVIEHKESNRMSVQSVAIVFGPTLLRPQTESPNMTLFMVFQSQIVELMLNQFPTIFSEK